MQRLGKVVFQLYISVLFYSVYDLIFDADTILTVRHEVACRSCSALLTDQHTDDPSQVGPLLVQVDEEISQVMADGAYDGAPTYQTIAQVGEDIAVIIPPRVTAVSSAAGSSPNQRDNHIEMINMQGRLAWQAATGYGQRALVETTIGRYKSLIGPRLRARVFEAQQTEAVVGVAVLNRMLAAGRPNSVRRQQVPA